MGAMSVLSPISNIPGVGDFLKGLFGGSSPGLKKAEGNAEGIAQYGIGQGEQNENEAGDYYGGILSGDPAKIAQSLAPAIAANTQEAQQKKQTIGEFGARSGGNTAAANNIDATTRANTTNLIGGALNNAAAGATGLGENQLNNATVNNQIAGNFSQQQLQNIINSLFGKGISAGVGAGEGALLG